MLTILSRRIFPLRLLNAEKPFFSFFIRLATEAQLTSETPKRSRTPTFHFFFFFVRSVSETHSAMVTIGQRDEMIDPTSGDAYSRYTQYSWWHQCYTEKTQKHTHAQAQTPQRSTATRGGEIQKENHFAPLLHIGT